MMLNLLMVPSKSDYNYPEKECKSKKVALPPQDKGPSYCNSVNDSECLCKLTEDKLRVIQNKGK